jgi:excisionase family DNA binding protein
MTDVLLSPIRLNELELLIESSVQRAVKYINVIPTQSQADQLLTIQQAAEFLKLSVPTLYGLVSSSAIPVSKKTKRLYFSKQDLLLWVKESRRKTVSEIEAEADSFLQTKKRGGSKL